jgi:hypothetical protein
VLLMDVNFDVTGVYAKPGFQPEARYKFKVHFDGADFEDLTYRISFGEPDPAEQQPLRLHALTGGRAGGLGGGAGAARRYRPDGRRLPASCSPTCCPTSWARRRRSASLAATAAPWPITPPRSRCLATGAAVPSGLKPSVASAQRSGTFPYVIPA